MRLERGFIYTRTVRDLYRRFHGLNVGLYTIGPCESGPENFDPGTSIGRYCSIYYTVRIFTRPLPTDSLIPAEILDACNHRGASEKLSAVPKVLIGNDVFIGHNSIVLPSALSIGDGAIIGAGSVVQQPIPPYAVVTGNPARVVRYRFSETKIAELMASKWWDRTIMDLAGEISEFQRPLEGDGPIR